MAAAMRRAVSGSDVERRLEEMARIACAVMDVPMAAICLVDDDTGPMLARAGVDDQDAGAVYELCRLTIAEPDGLFLQDAAEVAVAGGVDIGCYAGVRLRTAAGLVIGALGVLDRVPRTVGEPQRRSLNALAWQVASLLEFRLSMHERTLEELRDRRILESAIDYGIVSMDLAGRVTSWNEGARRLLGWTEDEMIGQSCEMFFTPADRATGIAFREMQSALRSGRGNDERWHLCKDGSQFWAQGEMMPLEDDGGQTIGFIKILRDRTEQHRSREQLEASRARLSLALDAGGVLGSWDWDVAAGRLTADERLAESFGVDPDKARAGFPVETFIEGIHPQDRDRVRAGIAAAMRDGGEYGEIYRLGPGGGEPRWVMARGRCLVDDEGRTVQFPGVVIDITERRSFERSLRVNETRSALAVEAAGIGLLESKADEDAIYFDARSAEILGLEGAGTISDRDALASLIHSEDRDSAVALLAKLDGPADDDTLDITFRVAQGQSVEPRWAHLMGRHVAREETGRLFVGMLLDVSEGKRAEEHRKLLAGELQHRVKNMLSMVQAVVQQTARPGRDILQVRDAIIGRVAALGAAQDLLTANDWTSASMRGVVDKAISLHAAGGERVRVDGPDLQLNARAALGLAMAIHELGLNAVKYGALSNERGVVELGWELSGQRGADAPETLEVRWRELDGPPVAEPSQRGFGSRLMSGLASDLGGAPVTIYAPAGLTWSLSAPLGHLTGA